MTFDCGARRLDDAALRTDGAGSGFPDPTDAPDTLVAIVDTVRALELLKWVNEVETVDVLWRQLADSAADARSYTREGIGVGSGEIGAGTDASAGAAKVGTAGWRIAAAGLLFLGSVANCPIGDAPHMSAGVSLARPRTSTGPSGDGLCPA